MSAEVEILVIDDDIPSLRLLTELLEREGYRVRPTGNAQLAIDSALARSPALILSDVRMPEIDGFEVCRRLKEDERTRDVPVIFISSLQDTEARVQGFEAGGVDFITKPFQEKEVLARVRTHTLLHQMQQHLETLVEERTEDLRKSEERFSLAVAGSAAGIWDWDFRSGEVFYSRRLKELLGHEAEAPWDSVDEFWDRLHPDEEQAVRADLDRHLAKDIPFRVDCRLLAKSEDYRWFYIRGQASWDKAGKPLRMAGSIIDITERKLAQENILKSERRFRALMEQSPLPIAIYMPDGKINQVNSAWLRQWGIKEEEIEEIKTKYNILEDEQLVDLGVDLLIKRAFSGENMVLPAIEYSGRRATGEIHLEHIKVKTVWIQVHLAPIMNENREIIFIVITNVDITALKRSEEMAQRQREALARMSRVAQMEQMTGSIAHEINQPLTGILSNAQAGEMMVKDGRCDSGDMAEIMGEIASDAKRASDVIQTLRDLYRKHEVEFRPVDMNALVEETEHLLRSEFILKKVEMANECAPGALPVGGTKVQLQQVLVNLIMNAAEAMKDTSPDGRLIRVATSHDKDEVRVWVEDSGPGIDADRIDTIFEPLATWKPGGTGMGLAISSSIIKAHGGRMWAENRPEGGARVGFTLPSLKEEGKA